jgi:predicted phage terminase large subunit-like protein
MLIAGLLLNHFFFKRNFSQVYIESANVGTALHDELKRELNQLIFTSIFRHRNKAHRARNVQGFVERGEVHVPEDQEIKTTFLSEVCQFRLDAKHRYDDITDTFMDAIELCFLKKVYKRNRIPGGLKSLSRRFL